VDKSPYKSDFVTANGIKLHYLDWGGSGPALLFIPGLGCNAHIFDTFAPRFTDKNQVLAVTRRGHGISDHPETGYDIETLTEDIHQFLDALKIDKVILAGHSMAHIEVSHFAVLHPERVLALVYLDAAYDRTSDSYKEMVANNPLRQIPVPGQGVDHYSMEEFFAAVKVDYPGLASVWGPALEAQGMDEIAVAPDGKIIETQSEAIGAACMDTLKSYVPEEAKIKSPALGIYAANNCEYYLADWMTEEQKAQIREHFVIRNDPWQEENIANFRKNMPHARVAIIPEGHHYCFLKKEEEVYKAMHEFLLEII